MCDVLYLIIVTGSLIFSVHKYFHRIFHTKFFRVEFFMEQSLSPTGLGKTATSTPDFRTDSVFHIRGFQLACYVRIFVTLFGSKP